jgi:hypothetical protein
MEFHVDTKKYKYKGIIQRRIPIMDSASIYGYVCIGIVGSYWDDRFCLGCIGDAA